MGSPVSKALPADMTAALAAAANKSVTKLPIAVAANLKKKSYIGKSALKGAVKRLSHVPSAYQG